MITETVRETAEFRPTPLSDFDGVTRVAMMAELLAKAEAERTRLPLPWPFYFLLPPRLSA